MKKILGIVTILIGFSTLPMGMYFLTMISFEQYFMTYIIVGIVSFLSPLLFCAIGLRTVASAH